MKVSIYSLDEALFPQNTLPAGSSNATSHITYAMQLLSMSDLGQYLPAGFPIYLWQDQSARYIEYWRWFTGEILEEVVGQTADGKPVFRYPLKINPVRDFARKHTAILFGEVTDTSTPLITSQVRPKTIFRNPSESAKTTAKFLEDVTNEVWTQSYGRSKQQENGLLSQFLGGSVFQISYQPWRKDLLIPIVVKNIYPNYFLPLWSSDDYYDLLEAWVVYLIDPVQAMMQFGVEPSGMRPAVYAEHWTKDYMQAAINGTPLVTTYPDGTTINYEKVANPFGFVPFVYTPRFREGSFYGSSFVPDIQGLALEYNARTADVGDAMQRTAHPRYTGTDLPGEIRTRKLDDKGFEAVDLGSTSPLNDAKAEIKALDPPKWNEAYSRHSSDLWTQMQRQGGLGPIAYGEDEGSQRSALTLAFRMWPSTVIAGAQRTNWTDGMIRLNQMILNMAQIKGLRVDSQSVPADFSKRFEISPQWLPKIPRDREALVNEMGLRVPMGTASPEHAMEAFGDVKDVDEERDQIEAWIELQSKYSQKQELKGGVDEPRTRSGLKEEPAE